MEKNKIYRWGILGAGNIAEKFCTALSFVNGCEVYAIASRDIDKAKLFAHKHHATRVYDDYGALMKDEAIDIIYIATPHSFHHVQTIDCLCNKKPVLCEKPISLGYNQTREMIHAAESNNVFFMEGMWTACMPFMDQIKSLIKEGVIGKVQFVSADFGFSAPVNMDGRLYNKALGGGAFMDVGVYPLYLATAILEEPTQVKVISKKSPTGVDECTQVLLQYANGECAQLLASIIFQTAIEATIIGTKGRIHISSPWFKATGFSLHLNDQPAQFFSMPHLSNGFEYEIKEVVYCLENGLLQSSKMPHELSVLMSKIADSILEQADVLYL